MNAAPAHVQSMLYVPTFPVHMNVPVILAMKEMVSTPVRTSMNAVVLISVIHKLHVVTHQDPTHVNAMNTMWEMGQHVKVGYIIIYSRLLCGLCLIVHKIV